ncbi:MAG TPA: hypothetical protein VIV14_07890, partial [Gammaproteobacteria bacterium]
MHGFVEELKRRNVVRVAAAYAVLSWLLVQIIVSVEEPLSLPDWTDTLVIVLLAVGFVLAVFLAWAYELTPDGIKRTKSVPLSLHASGRRIDFLIIGALVLALGFVVVDQYVFEDDEAPKLVTDAPLEPSDRPSIVVLPFANVSADEAQEYFADGLTDDLITDLNKISGLFVIGRTSSFSFKGAPVRVEAVADSLGVRYIVAGSVRRDGNAVRVTAELVDGMTGGQIWSNQYDRELTGLFAVQDELVAQIVSSLAVELTRTEELQLVHEPPTQFRAYDLYLQAREAFFGGGDVGLRRSLELFEDSWEADPDFARAYAGYARASVDIWRQSSPRVQSNAVARANAERAALSALNRDATIADAHSVLALLQLGDLDHEAAIESARRAVELDPNGVDARTALAIVLIYSGEPLEALMEMETALRLDPRANPYVLSYYGLTLFLNGRYQDAIAALEPVADAQDQNMIVGDSIRVVLASSYAMLGELDVARAQVDVLLRQLPYLSLEHYRVFYALHSRMEDVEPRIEALRRAGIPQWPFGYEGDPEQQLRGEELDAVIYGRSWTGRDTAMETNQFFVFISDDGQMVFRSDRQSVIAEVFAR